MKRIVIDTNVYIDWLATGEHERWLVGSGLVRHVSSVVLMELRAGALSARTRRAVSALARAAMATGRLVEPSRNAWLSAGVVLQKLRGAGRETRRASLVNDVLVAISVRELGALLITRDESDHGTISDFVHHTFATPDTTL